jgi:nitroreductase
MDFFKLIAKRRSIREYLPQRVEPEKAALIVEAALRAPSSRGLNPWEFIVVDVPDIITELAKAKQHGSSFLKGAPLAVVVCADPGKCDVWVEDASIASIYISLAAEGLDLGSCWIQIRERAHNSEKTAEEFVREVLNIPPNIKVESIIAIGYPDRQIKGHQREDLQFEKISQNSYGEKSPLASVGRK